MTSTVFQEDNASFYDLEYFLSLEYRYFSGSHHSRTRNILKALGPIGGKRMLDVGCGGGFFAHTFASRGAIVTGIDYSPFAIQFARDRFPDLEFRQHSAYELQDFPAASFDVVTLLDVIEHIGNHSRLFEGIRHVLRPGGRLLISTDFADSKWNRGWCRRFYNAAQILSSEGRAYRLIKKVEAYRRRFRNYHASHIAELSYGDLEDVVTKNGFYITKHCVYPLVGVPARDWVLSLLPLDFQGNHQLVVAL